MKKGVIGITGDKLFALNINFNEKHEVGIIIETQWLHEKNNVFFHANNQYRALFSIDMASISCIL